MKNILYLAGLLIIITSCSHNDDAFDASGAFEANETIISSEASGVIKAFDVFEGGTLNERQQVGWIDSTQLYLKKKQLMAQIRSVLAKKPHIAIQLASLEEQLRAAEREQRRVANLYKADAATEKQRDDADAQVDVIRRQIAAQESSLVISSQSLTSETLPLKAQIDQLDDQLTKCRIVNPVAGTVLAKYVEPFEVVSAGKPLYRIADIRNLDLRAYITGNQLALIRLNQKTSVLVDDGKEGYKTYEGAITWISDKAEFTPKTIQTKDERADLVYPIKVRVKNDGYLKIGMYGEVKF